MDSYENDAILASERCNELINEMKCRLDDYEKFLESLASTDEDKKSKMVEMFGHENQAFGVEHDF